MAELNNNFSVPGSITRIELLNFMQYDEVAFQPGPHLNVLIGPNGSGKSSIVNAIHLGLNGRIQALGRAANITEFIRTGKEEARIKITLFPGTTVERRIGLDGKSHWFLNGKSVSGKKVEDLIKSLNIQTGNLCQFLPQDKVHEFSKMNSKELMNKTIESTGKEELQRDHDTLKRMQSELIQSEEVHNNRVLAQADLKRKLDAMEADVKNFTEKDELEKKIRAFHQFKQWVRLQEQKRICEKSKSNYDEIKDGYVREQERSKPIRRQRETLKGKVTQNEGKRANLKADLKSKILMAKNSSQRIETIEEEIETIQNDIEDTNQREQERKEEQEKLAREMEDLREEYRNAESDPTLEPKISELQRDITSRQHEITGIESSKRDVQDEQRAIHNRIQRIQNQIDEANSVQRQKFDVLRTMRQGQDAFKAAKWLHSNQDQFKGRIHPPIMTLVEMHNPKNAVYLENLVAVKDLVSFVAEDVDDMNKFVNLARDQLRVRINCVHSDPSVNPDRFKPLVKPEEFKNMDFKGYANDLFTVPAPVMSFLCNQYKLHLVPVFGQSADRKLNVIVEGFKKLIVRLMDMQKENEWGGNNGLMVFFIGLTRYSITVSKYSGQASTSSNKVAPRRWLEHTCDKGKIRELNKALSDENKKKEAKIIDIQRFQQTFEESTQEMETLLISLKDLKQKRDQKNYLKSRLQTKEKDFKRFLNDHSLVDRKRKYTESLKALVKEGLDSSDKLLRAIKEANLVKKQSFILRLQGAVYEAGVNKLNQDLTEIEEAISEMKGRVDEALGVLNDAKHEETNRLREAQDAMGNGYRWDKPPKALTEQCRNWHCPDSPDAIEVILGEMKTQCECIEGVDPRIIRKYKAIQEESEELAKEIDKHVANTNARKGSIDEIRTRWLTGLGELVEGIAHRFAHYFASMGFAGDVVLHEGEDVNDFHNYGFDILVKYRHSAQLQKLTPHQQSGGERSVATALYMMALQEQTVVPFRCVDEINQGMDAVNERRVFDMLVQTSCKENSAQYFLLTPKLLPDLNYHENLTVLIVNNGEYMCHHTQWNLDGFIQAVQAR